MSDATSQTTEVRGEDRVDEEIDRCLRLASPRSFFLYAGAGSGKTRSLVTALNHLLAREGSQLRANGRRVGVITYTNAACDEINRRLDFNPLIEVSTIHSFAWNLIGGFNSDIKKWLEQSLKEDIAELREAEAKGRASKASDERKRKLVRKQKRLEQLPTIKRFVYSPVGDNRGRDALNHAEVIQMCAGFLTSKRLMAQLLVSKFPILLVDESQDTNKGLMDAFFSVEAAHKGIFCLGLIGDMMQRIYADGKADLGQRLPEDWAKPAKSTNYRCPRRVVSLLNRIRSAVDTHQQHPKADAEDGTVRLFVFPSHNPDKPGAESRAAAEMARLTGDDLWIDNATVKTLILEHHMAAGRMGFAEMFAPLYLADRLQTGLLEGKLTGLRFFSQTVLPLILARQAGDEFAVSQIVRKASPLLEKSNMLAAGKDQRIQIGKVRDAVSALAGTIQGNSAATFMDVLQEIRRTGLFEIPDSISPILSGVTEVEARLDDDPTLAAWIAFSATRFSQISHYEAYVSGKAPFATHQGVKGLEFPRVMVVIDDSAARGFMFSYETLFGAKSQNRSSSSGETSIDRTRRLFYVTCSRAVKSLAIIAYSENPRAVRDHVIREQWFEESEVMVAAG